MDVVGEGGSCGKSEIISQRVPKTRGVITEGAIKEFKLEGDEWKGETEVVRGASFTSGFDIDEITQIGWFRFMNEIVSNRYDCVL